MVENQDAQATMTADLEKKFNEAWENTASIKNVKSDPDNEHYVYMDTEADVATVLMTMHVADLFPSHFKRLTDEWETFFPQFIKKASATVLEDSNGVKLVMHHTKLPTPISNRVAIVSYLRTAGP